MTKQEDINVKSLLWDLFFLLISVLLMATGVVKFVFSSFFNSQTSSQENGPDNRIQKTYGNTTPNTPVQPPAALGLTETKAAEKQPEVDTSIGEITTIPDSPESNNNEVKAKEIMAEVGQLLDNNKVSDEERDALTDHRWGYYAHYYAAKFQLSQGDLSGFRHEMTLAKAEVTDMEEILQRYRLDLPNHAQGFSVA